MINAQKEVFSAVQCNGGASGAGRIEAEEGWLVGLGGVGLDCLTRTRLLCQKERGLSNQRESRTSWASEEGGKLGP